MLAAHDANPVGVYLVEVWEGDGYRHGIFSTSALARAWMESLPLSARMVCAPFILDEPDAGSETQH